MKKIIFTMVFASASLFITNNTKAQVHVSINIGSQPAWAPQGYDNAQYYYMPDMDIYYDVPARQFVYLSNNHWMRSSNLPAAYGRFDLYKVHKVSINQRNAFMNHDRDRKQYAQFKGKFDQQPIRDTHNDRYSNNRNDSPNNNSKIENGKNKQESREVVKHDSRYDNRNNQHNDRDRR